MDKINYIISSSTSYERLICNDAGPGYAKSMGWISILIANLTEFDKSQVYVIDNRISFEECITLEKIIIENYQVNFIAKVVDPFFENTNHYYFEWIRLMLTLDNFRLLSVYEPKELLKSLIKESKKAAIIVPYPYESGKEIPLNDLKSRKNKIIISGAINSIIYPYRSFIWKKSRRSISRLFYDVLKHPGYPEMDNSELSHKLVGSEFIKHLSNYKFMLTCGSRCRIEFLKFHEVAYSGCIPVGEFPTIFEHEAEALFRKPDSSRLILSTTKILLEWNEDDHISTVKKYRAYLFEHRNLTTLTQSFFKQL